MPVWMRVVMVVRGCVTTDAGISLTLNSSAATSRTYAPKPLGLFSAYGILLRGIAMFLDRLASCATKLR
jgi:hypothetical protein